ncbi:MAG: hypothetical protein ISR96_05600 [Nitrospira sp.]|nr:hypothetical protein [bacterium]MBL7048973.1 hypothetical protein [Nitrospira sp.]
MANREVVITGMGLTSPLGSSVEENWANIMAMKTGIRHFPAEDRPAFLQYMGVTDHHKLPEDIPQKQRGQMKFLNRGALLGFCAAYEAIAGAAEGIAAITPGRRALYVASGDFTRVGSEFMYPAVKDAVDEHWKTIDHEKLNNAALNKVNPFFLLESLHNNLFSFLSAFAEFMGPNTSLASLSPNGGNTLELASRSIRQNKADIALAVGYGNWITEIPIYELEGLGILSGCRQGVNSFRPFDRKRDGFIPGEGGAALMLESAESAENRGARILGRIKGFSNTVEFESNKTISVPGKVSEYNMQDVLKTADCKAEDLSFIIPHGSGTVKGDRSELNSLLSLTRASGTSPIICGLKPYTGHMGAASDLAEIITGVKAMQEKTVPATLNFLKSDKDFNNLKISAEPQPCSHGCFLSLSYGVGGQSSSVIIESA